MPEQKKHYLDVVMTVAPHADGEFVELEDQEGRGVGDNTAYWVPSLDDENGLWRLRIPVRANLGMATTQELIAELHARACVSDTIGERWPHYRTVDQG